MILSLTSEQASPDKSEIADDLVLDVQGVSKQFTVGKRSVVALADVSLQAQRSGIVGLIGPDGAGKTTLMRLAAGLLRLIQVGSGSWGSMWRITPERFSP